MAKSSVTVLGIDLGKNSCSLVGPTAKLPACVVAMEACCGAHHLGRLLAAQGHAVWLMSPEYVRPYVKAQKNEDRDAEAIAEAATRPTMRFVPLKAQDQLDMQSLHRVRSRLVGMRTMLMNQLRAILLEYGLFIHGARAALASLSKAEDATGRWLRGLLARAHYNVVVIALAAKLARIAWSTWRKGGELRTTSRAGRGLSIARGRYEPDRSARVHEVCGRAVKMA